MLSQSWRKSAHALQTACIGLLEHAALQDVVPHKALPQAALPLRRRMPRLVHTVLGSRHTEAGRLQQGAALLYSTLPPRPTPHSAWTQAAGRWSRTRTRPAACAGCARWARPSRPAADSMSVRQPLLQLPACTLASHECMCGCAEAMRHGEAWVPGSHHDTRPLGSPCHSPLWPDRHLVTADDVAGRADCGPMHDTTAM